MSSSSRVSRNHGTLKKKNAAENYTFKAETAAAAGADRWNLDQEQEMEEFSTLP